MRPIHTVLTALAALALVACAVPSGQRAPAPEQLFADQLFGAPADDLNPAQVFAMSDDMRRYFDKEMTPLVGRLGPKGALVEALYNKGHLKLDYEASTTRNAAQAFAARSGNCLSLVIMTTAFARELGLPVRFQSAYIDEAWTRKGDLLLRSGHVNLTLGKRIQDRTAGSFPDSVTIDFLPPADVRSLKTTEISESLVVAMFMNNRAVEALVQGRLDDAYAWAREAVRADPSFLAAQNTLGVVYLRRGALPQAGAAFTYALAIDPNQTRVLANLAEVASREGRVADAAQLRARLAQLEPEPPLHHLNLGLAALQRGDYKSARDHLAKEAARGDDAADVHYWLGVANYRLGDVEAATRELGRAAELSASRSERDLYSAKLDWLRAHRAN